MTKNLNKPKIIFHECDGILKPRSRRKGPRRRFVDTVFRLKVGVEVVLTKLCRRRRRCRRVFGGLLDEGTRLGGVKIRRADQVSLETQISALFGWKKSIFNFRTIPTRCLPQCDQIAWLFFKIWPFFQWKLDLNHKYFSQSMFKTIPNIKSTLKIAKDF